LAWRTEWAHTANQHLTHAGLDIRIDHRTLEAQGIELLPGRKIGVSAERQQHPDLPLGIAERVTEQREIAAESRRRILENPRRALRALTHTQPTFKAHAFKPEHAGHEQIEAELSRDLAIEPTALASDTPEDGA
jgi:ATP-dependent exoDNAse (exonuclease V) alpha subunit